MNHKYIRRRRFSSSKWAFFCIGHGYQQIGGVIATFLLGVIFGAVYLWRGSLVAPIVIHFMQNAATVLLATMKGG